METESSSKSMNTVGAAALIGVAVIVVVVLLFSRSEMEVVPRVHTGELVQVMEAQERYAAPRIVAQGTVVPARRVTVRPEVSGRVMERHPGLVAGGVVQRGETVLRVDPRDYQLAVDEARNGVERARAEFSMEEGRQVVARQEWARFGSGDEEPPPLALREPQLRQAELDIGRAEHQLTRALLELERTRLRAPFTGLVTEAAIEVGELVTPSSTAATLVALDEFWVQVAVPVDVLDVLAIPGRDGDEGSRAFVRNQGSERVVEHQGQIIRLMGELDPAGRMARVLVRVADPFSLLSDSAEPDMPSLRSQPLMLGAYVTVEFEGARGQNVVELPRAVLHEGQYIYIAREDNTLEIRPVTTAWRTRDTIALAEGVAPGERIIVSGMAAPVEGMVLRVEPVAEDYFVLPEATPLPLVEEGSEEVAAPAAPRLEVLMPELEEGAEEGEEELAGESEEELGSGEEPVGEEAPAEERDGEGEGEVEVFEGRSSEPGDER